MSVFVFDLLSEPGMLESKSTIKVYTVSEFLADLEMNLVEPGMGYLGYENKHNSVIVTKETVSKTLIKLKELEFTHIYWKNFYG